MIGEAAQGILIAEGPVGEDQLPKARKGKDHRGLERAGVALVAVRADKQHHQRLAKLMEEAGYGHILKKYTLPQDIQEWYEGELQRRHEQLREHLDTPKESFYRTELESFRSMFHKPVIYATWDWSSTVEDALHQAGFASFEEQAAALEEYRKIKF